MRAKAWASGWRARRLAQIGAGSMAGVLALSGVSVAAGRSLPGDPLYGLKRGAESVRLFFTQTEMGAGQLHLHFARTRLSEVADLAGEHASASQIVSTLHDLDSDTVAGARELTNVWKHHHNNKALQLLATFAQQEAATLSSIESSLPPGALRAAAHSLAVLGALRTDASALLGATCGITCIPTGSGGSSPAPVPGATPAPSEVPATSGTPKPG